MENAALAVTQAALEMLRPARHGGAVIVCGGGNNGGDGLAVARHLHNRGVSVEIALAVDPEAYKGDARINWQIIKAMGLKVTPADETESALARGAGLIVDALFGTGLSAPPRDARTIELMNKHGAAILAVDLPSGLDCDTGEPLGPACVRAARTVTFVAEKVGFANLAARQYLGRVTVGDIGCPRELIASVARGAAQDPAP